MGPRTHEPTCNVCVAFETLASGFLAQGGTKWSGKGLKGLQTHELTRNIRVAFETLASGFAAQGGTKWSGKGLKRRGVKGRKGRDPVAGCATTS